MRILEKDLRKGAIKVLVESPDDLWLLYNVIEKGDLVTASTTRDIKFEKGRGERIPMTLTIRVETLEFQSFTGRLRIKGIVVEGPEKFGVKGHYHTLNIDIGNVLTIVKKEWPRYIVKKLEKLAHKRANVLLVAIDYDEAAIAIMSHQGLKVLYEASSRLPGKDSGDYEARLKTYIKEIASIVIGSVNRYNIEAVIIAGPGYLKKYVGEIINEKLGGKIKIYYDNVSMGGWPGVNELSKRDIVKEVLRDLEVVKAQKVYERFMEYLAKNDSVIAYGLDEIEEAARNNAVEKLVIAESFFRINDEELRQRIERVLEEIDKRRGEIIFAPLESSVEKQVMGLGGMIAILRYPLKYLREKPSGKTSK